MKITYRYLMENKLSKDDRVPSRGLAAFPREGGKQIKLTKPDKEKAFKLFVAQKKERNP